MKADGRAGLGSCAGAAFPSQPQPVSGVSVQRVRSSCSIPADVCMMEKNLVILALLSSKSNTNAVLLSCLCSCQSIEHQLLSTRDALHISPPLLPFTDSTSLRRDTQHQESTALAPTALLTLWWREAAAGTPGSTPPREGDSLGPRRAGWSPAQAQPGWLRGLTPAIRSHRSWASLAGEGARLVQECFRCPTALIAALPTRKTHLAPG